MRCIWPCYYHVTYLFQSWSTLYGLPNVVLICAGRLAVCHGLLVACVQGWGLGALAPRLSMISCWEASVTLYLWFRFRAWSMIAICSRYCSPGGVINGSCGNYGSFLAWGGPLRAVGEGGLWSVPKVESSAHARLAFRSLACWEASVTLHLWFRF